MIKQLCSLCIIALLFSAVFCEVTDLTDANFDEAVAGKTALVTFFAPWCGHCKRWHEPFDELSERFDGTDIAAFRVDVTENKSISARFGIRGIPTIFALKDGEEHKYSGQRTPDAVYEWVTQL